MSADRLFPGHTTETMVKTWSKESMSADPVLHYLAQVNARLEKATPGPWEAFQRPAELQSNYCRIRIDPTGDDNLAGYCGIANAALIAHAPTDLSFLTRLVAGQARVIEAYEDCNIYEGSTRSEINQLREAESTLAAIKQEIPK